MLKLLYITSVQKIGIAPTLGLLRVTKRHTQYEEQDISDQLLRSEDNSPISLDEFRDEPYPVNEEQLIILPLEAPKQFLRRAVKEFDSGFLDDLLVHKLIYLDRNSAEFRKEYIRLRVESMMKPRRSHVPLITNASMSGNTEEKEFPINSPPLESPTNLIRLAIKELESGLLDIIVLHKLTSLDRHSAEFRQEYVKLRVESLLRPRISSKPFSKIGVIAGNTGEQDMPEGRDYKHPWVIYTISDLWHFFGPLLSTLIVLQLYYSYKLGAHFKSYEILHGNITLNLATIIIALVSLFISARVLYACRGMYYKRFFPRLIGIVTLSVVIALASFLLEVFPENDPVRHAPFPSPRTSQ